MNEERAMAQVGFRYIDVGFDGPVDITEEVIAQAEAADYEQVMS